LPATYCTLAVTTLAAPFLLVPSAWGDYIKSVAATSLPKGSFANIVERANRSLLGYRYAFVIEFEIVEKYSSVIKSTQQNLIRLALLNYRYQILRRQILSHHTL